MNKHLSMLFAAAVALAASPAFAACPASTTCDDVTTVLSSPIQTKTATSGSPDNIQIESTAGVKVHQAGAAVTVNSSNFLVNDGTITNAGTTGAQGILIDAGAATIDTTLTSQKGVTNGGTIDLTGSGDNKTGILLQNGTMIGPLILTPNSVIKVSGDGSRAIAIAPTGILQGDMTLDGTITATPTNAGSLSAPNIPVAAVDLAGTINGNFSSTAVITSSGAGSQGIIVRGPICDALGCASATRTAGDFGSFTNLGSITVLGKVGQGPPTSAVVPEGGSVLVVNSNIEGGIANGSPVSSVATLSGSGASFVTNAGQTVDAVVSIASTGNPVTIGENTSDPVGSPNFSFLNFGTIFAEPSSANVSTTAINITGANASNLTTLTGGFYNQGVISAIATTTNGPNAANAFANTVVFGNFSVVPVVQLSNAAGAGTISASVSGQVGGSANAIVFQAAANNGNPTTNPATIDVLTGTRVLASATTLNPSAVITLNSAAILDLSGTVTRVNNAGTIAATVTTLTSDKNTPGFSNQARAIDLSKNSVGGITINNAGTIVGDVLLNGTQSGATPTIVNVGAGAASGADAAQQAAATAAAAAVAAPGSGGGGTGVTNSSVSKATLTGAVVFGAGTSKLYVNDFGVVSGPIYSSGTLDVGVAQNGELDVMNTGEESFNNTFNMTVHTLNVYGLHATLDITVTDSLRQLNLATIQGQGAGTAINIDSGSTLGIKIASFVPQPTIGNSVEYKLIEGPTGTVSIPDLVIYQTNVENNLPFYFNRDVDCLTGAVQTNCSLQFKNNVDDRLVLDLRPKSAAQLGLVGDALTMFGPVNTALGKIVDDQLGAAIINGIHDQTSAEQVFSQFAPDVSGNERAIAVALTDQATGPTAARQRVLRMYANQGGELTIWGQEYAQYINDKGNTVGGGLTNFKDHGFGFAIGADGGDPIDGWYGGALTYFAGDATETQPRNAKAQTDWYMLTGYTDWRGHHLFLDTQLSVALAHVTAKRTLTIKDQNGVTLITREADSKRPGLLGAIGATTGAIFNLGNLFLMPEISLDGMTLREEGFKENGGGNGFDLQVDPYYTTSLRTFIGADSRIDWDLGDFLLQPEARLGYRFEMLNDPVKLHAAFEADPTNTQFVITGPDPARGNVVAGATLGASTDTFSLGVNFDWVRGSNGSQTEVGTVSLLGRI